MDRVFRKSLWGYNITDVDCAINNLEKSIHELKSKCMGNQQEIGKLKLTVDDLTAMLEVQKEISKLRKELSDK